MLLGSISRLPEDLVEKKMAGRQLSIKGEKSHSWFVGVKDILLKYDLPLPWALMESPPNKLAWKRC